MCSIIRVKSFPYAGRDKKEISVRLLKEVHGHWSIFQLVVFEEFDSLEVENNPTIWEIPIFKEIIDIK